MLTFSDAAKLLQQPQFGFALAVFDQAQLARCGADGGTQVVQRQSRLLAQMAHAAAQADDVQFSGRRDDDGETSRFQLTGDIS
jgi:hypothetical protein